METRTKIALGVGAVVVVVFFAMRSRSAGTEAAPEESDTDYLGSGAYSVPFSGGIATPSAGTIDGTTIAGAGLNLDQLFANQIASENRQLASAERIAARNSAASMFDSVISRGEDTAGRVGGRSKFTVNLSTSSSAGQWTRLKGAFVEDLRPLAPKKYPAPITLPQGAPVKIKVDGGLF